MWYLFTLIFQATCFFLWCCTLFNLSCLSIFTFFLFSVVLSIFVFWLIITCIAWSIGIIPILKVILIPWYQRQCRSWTRDTRKSRLSIGFFQPHCTNGSDSERVLWTTIESISKRYHKEIQILIYTGDVGFTSEEILRRAEQCFGINFKPYRSSITFIYLRSRCLIDAKYYSIFSVLGPSLGSIIVGFEALLRFIPDIYFDSTGFAFTYPCFHYFANIPIIAYIHQPIITTDLLDQSNETSFGAWRLESSVISQIESISYQLFAYVYGWCGRCSQMIFCDSQWTKTHIDSIWGSSRVHLIYPPCDIQQPSATSDSADEDEQKIVSVGPFRPDQNHQVQIQAFQQLLERFVRVLINDVNQSDLFRHPEYRQKLRLILIGRVQDNDQRRYVEHLRTLIESLNLNEEVQFKFDLTRTDLQTELKQATIGLHTKHLDSFSICKSNRPANTSSLTSFNLALVDMMAASLIVLAHRSGAPQVDIIDDGQTGYLADDLDSYATAMNDILTMPSDQRRQIQEHVRDSVARFSPSSFEQSLMEQLDGILRVQ